MNTTFARDRHWFRTADGLGVLAGSPLTQFTVTTAGARILDALEAGDPLPDGHQALSARLLAVGAIHPVGLAPVDSALISVVVPTRTNTPAEVDRLQELVDSLAQFPVIVVDDASATPVTVHDADIVRHDHNTGPGGARNTGLTRVTTPYVAFIDDDASIDPMSVRLLAAHLEATGAAVAAPRVRSRSTDTALGEYERDHSPLDMGPRPAVVKPTSRVSYVPSAMIVARVEAIRHAHGFTDSMRIGEDVDLVWRLVETGATVRYVPEVEATHQPRSGFAAFVTQRFRYGTSAAGLAARHGSAVAPLRTHFAMLAPLLLLAAGKVALSVAATLVMYGWFVFSLRSTRTSVVDRFRIITIGARSTVVFAVQAVARTWWPVFMVLSGVSETISMVWAVCVVAPAVIDVVRTRPHNPVAHLGLFILDNFSYGAGVWAGAIRARSIRCLMPALTVSSRRLRSQG